MDCAEFLARSSELLDGRIGDEEEAELEAHLSACTSCREYQTTLEKGLALFRSLPPVEVSEDFRPTIHQRVRLSDEFTSLSQEASGSGATTVSVMAIAALLAFVAWAPKVGFRDAVVELPAIVVDRPPAYAFTPRPRRPSFPRGPSLFTATGFQDGLWGDTHQLLFEYSSLYQRRRGPTLSRVGLQ